MRRIAHISDLHFGAADDLVAERLVEPLVDELLPADEIGADQAAVFGDVATVLAVDQEAPIVREKKQGAEDAGTEPEAGLPGVSAQTESGGGQRILALMCHASLVWVCVQPTASTWLPWCPSIVFPHLACWPASPD